MTWVTDYVDNLAGRYLQCVCGRVVKVKQGAKYNLDLTRHVHN